MVENNYIRTVVYYFKKGDTNVNKAGAYHVKVIVEHFFRADTNMTFDFFKQRHKTMLTQNSGKLSDDFKVAPNSNTASEF